MIDASWYLDGFKKEVGWRRIGREAELPLVRRDDARTGDASLLWNGFGPGWQRFYDDTNQDFCVGVKHEPSGWIVTTDAGRGIIEVISPVYEDLFGMQTGFDETLHECARIAKAQDMCILGYGVHPRTPGSKFLWVKKGRYGALTKSLGDKFVHDATIVASDQCHVDIAQSEVVAAVNVMNALSGAIIALTANSTISGGGPNGLYAWRELFWDKFDGFMGQVGIPRQWFETCEEWFDHLISQRFVLRKVGDGVYEPRGETFRSFLIEHGSRVTLTDFNYHEGCLWWTARPRRLYSTIEVRPACQQPPHEHMVVQALTLGLVNNLTEAEKHVKTYEHQSWVMYRRAAAASGLKTMFAGRSSSEMLERVLKIAEKGLRDRGRGEEGFLWPLYARLGEGKLPGDAALDLWNYLDEEPFLNYFAYSP